MLGFELRWVRKIFITSATGKAEVERQGGLYVDVEGEEVTSNPTSTTTLRAAYWISVAERSFGLLQDGDFAEPYGQLSTYLETLPRPLPSLEKLDEKLKQLRVAE